MMVLAMDTHPTSELELIALSRKGNIAAFEQIVYAYEKRIFAHVYRMVEHKEDAEDITQETFVKVYKKLHTFDSAQRFATWLYTIATNTAYDYLRRKRRAREVFAIDDPDRPFETIGEDAPYKGIEDKDLLARALERIKPAYQTILMLYYKEGLSYEDIGASLNIPLNTVKTHLRRAKEALKNTLEQTI